MKITSFGYRLIQGSDQPMMSVRLKAKNQRTYWRDIEGTVSTHLTRLFGYYPALPHVRASNVAEAKRKLAELDRPEQPI